MTGRGGGVLYSHEILALAVALAEFPLTSELTLRGETQSRVCGSRVTMGIATDEAGRVEQIGARVTACAIGQAAAALFMRGATGRSGQEIAAAAQAIEAWLAGGESLPDWPEIDRLSAARSYPARHPAILLPWKAARAALSNPARAA